MQLKFVLDQSLIARSVWKPRKSEKLNMSKGETDILQQQSYAMVGGDGAHSYAKNSSYQV